MSSAASAWLVIAETGGGLTDFGPYVASLNDLGTVAFRAQRADGGSGVFLGDGAALRALEADGEVVGHPALNNSGQVSFLTRTKAGAPAFWLVSGDGTAERAVDSGTWADVGPRGPVMNEMGSAVFGGRMRDGREAVFCASGGKLHAVLTSGEPLRSFPGLPVIHLSGGVACTAETTSGHSVIVLRRRSTVTSVASTLDEFQELGAFPSFNDAGQVAFTGVLKSGGPGAYLWTDEGRVSLTDGRGTFESVRSALLHGRDGHILCATPRGGRLGVYRGAGQETQRILGIGDAFKDSTIADFALNAVSVNAHGQFALRLRLANGRQFILRVGTSAP